MTTTHTICSSFKQELLMGIHDLSSDDLKIALFEENASLNRGTTEYTDEEEVSGSGYTAGGAALATVLGFPKLNESDEGAIPAGTIAIVDFDDTLFSSVTVEARYALIYNSSKDNRAIAVIDFAQTLIPDGGDFAIQWPLATASKAIIRI